MSSRKFQFFIRKNLDPKSELSFRERGDLRVAFALVAKYCQISPAYKSDNAKKSIIYTHF